MFSLNAFTYIDILMLLPVNAIIPLLSRSVLLTGFPCHIIFLLLAMFSIALFKKKKDFLMWAILKVFIEFVTLLLLFIFMF